MQIILLCLLTMIRFFPSLNCVGFLMLNVRDPIGFASRVPRIYGGWGNPYRAIEPPSLRKKAPHWLETLRDRKGTNNACLVVHSVGYFSHNVYNSGYV